MICGNGDRVPFLYRSSSKLTRFFRDIDTDYVHTGETRDYWVAEVLRKIMLEPSANQQTPPDTFLRVIKSLMDKADAIDWDPDRDAALQILNTALNREGSRPSTATMTSATSGTSARTRSRSRARTRTAL